jgi:PET assembly of cytochrome c oxidase, mitochondrial
VQRQFLMERVSASRVLLSKSPSLDIKRILRVGCADVTFVRHTLNSQPLVFCPLTMRRYLPAGGPAMTFVAVASAAIGAVLYSHYAQKWEKETMRAGVERDKERLRMLKQQRLQQKEQQEP